MSRLVLLLFVAVCISSSSAYTLSWKHRMDKFAGMYWWADALAVHCTGSVSIVNRSIRFSIDMLCHIHVCRTSVFSSFSPFRVSQMPTYRYFIIGLHDVPGFRRKWSEARRPQFLFSQQKANQIPIKLQSHSKQSSSEFLQFRYISNEIISAISRNGIHYREFSLTYSK